MIERGREKWDERRRDRKREVKPERGQERTGVCMCVCVGGGWGGSFEGQQPEGSRAALGGTRFRSSGGNSLVSFWF